MTPQPIYKPIVGDAHGKRNNEQPAQKKVIKIVHLLPMISKRNPPVTKQIKVGTELAY